MVAAGSGSRFGGAKQYHECHGRRVLDWSLDAAWAVSHGVVLVVHPDYLGDPEDRATAVVAGGQSRGESVRNGLAAVPGEVECVLVHDAARPAASIELFSRVVKALCDNGAVIPGVAVVDTIKQIDNSGRVIATPARDHLRAIQTPQGFRADVLRRAYESGCEGTDDAAVVEAAGVSVLVIDGESANLKITTRLDLTAVAATLSERDSK